MLQAESRMVYVFDFDRVLYDTTRLIAYVRALCDEEGICTEETYKRVYKVWSDRARATHEVAKLSIDEQQRLVSWTKGFIPFLADELARGDATKKERVVSQLQEIHDKGLHNPDFLYAHAIELLHSVPKEDAFIFTAGGQYDQHEKLLVTGMYDLLPDGHIIIIPAKTKEEFEEAFRVWGIQPADIVVHVNDRKGEFAPVHEIHDKTVSIWATWAHPEDSTLRPAEEYPAFIVARAIAECEDILGHLGHGVEFVGRSAEALR